MPARAKGASFCVALLMFCAALGGRLARDRGVVEEAGDVSPVAGKRLQRRVPIARQTRQLPALLGQDVQHPVGLAKRRIGSVDHLAEVLAASGEPGPQLVEDQPEPVAEGQALDVLNQVEVDRCAVVLQRQ